jgi:hypothetical protein
MLVRRRWLVIATSWRVVPFDHSEMVACIHLHHGSGWLAFRQQFLNLMHGTGDIAKSITVPKAMESKMEVHVFQE